MGGMEQKSRVVRPRNGMNQHKRSIICISAVILLLAAVVIMSSVSLSAKNKSYIAQEKGLKAQIAEEEKRTEEIDELEEYVETDEYIEQVAKDKLGLVHENEILFRAN